MGPVETANANLKQGPMECVSAHQIPPTRGTWRTGNLPAGLSEKRRAGRREAPVAE